MRLECFFDCPDIALVIIFAGKKAISYIANKEDRASKNASYAQSFKIPSETMDIIRDHLTSFIGIIVICLLFIYRNKGTGDPTCKQCKVSLN
ncbi:hypothetical protein A4R26_20750 [Niastella populi]|uniref:Uncharacterized protein n=1 Tax=Niastella populi TaxID=550983 RepID=A0A1V9FN82_9BACT|nr:hypothetical protein A4R26_20750 [Niastella populi]